MSESIVREIDKWKISATQRPDGSWFIEAFDTTWARDEDIVAATLEQGLVLLAPRLQLDQRELLDSFGL